LENEITLDAFNNPMKYNLYRPRWSRIR